MATSTQPPYPEGATYVLRTDAGDAALPVASDGPVIRCDPGAGLGNLGATLQWARDHAVPAGGARLLHDGGAASRAFAWAQPLGGRRSRLPLPGRWPTLLDAAVAWAPPLRPGRVDLLWTSQLVLHSPASPADATIVKWAAALSPEVPGATALGWFKQTPRLAMLPGRTANDADALRRWGGGARLLADVGNARLFAPWLTEVARGWDGARCDLDPDLTAPWLAGARPAWGPPDVALWEVAEPTWWRLRGPREVHAALRDPRLRTRLTEGQPCARATANGVSLDGLTETELAAGVEVGGCWLRDVTLTDVHLARGSHLDGVTAVRSEGRWTAHDAVILQTRSNLSALDALLVDAQGPPTPARGEVWAAFHRTPW
jgi:hypothetical protein